VSDVAAEAPRRASWEASRARILQAAREQFGRRGYRGTTTKDLAAAAGVAEKTLFRHFPSKGELFKDAVITPFSAFISDYVRRWEARPRGRRDDYEEVLELYSGLFDVLEENRTLVLALLSAQAFEDPDSVQFPELHHELDGLLAGLERLLAVEAAERGYPVDAPVTIRLMFGIVLTSAVHADWLFAPGRHPGRRRLLAELSSLTVFGVANRPR